ncbi:MAG: peptide MFS transporter [Bacteriovoracaceae bacterium]|nr:peptide MFS transporter [Bacteriovoracaceae bacterium]
MNAVSSAVGAPKKGDDTVFGHPKGLMVLFFTEMWERFSYYGMRALLILYMTQYLILDPEKAKTVLGYEQLKGLLEMAFGHLDVQPFSSQLYGLYTGFVYLSPLFGGILADKVLGQRKTVYVGAILMAIGHFLMASESMFLVALFFLVLGNGAFKPNISTQVGNLYQPGDPRRDGAFTIFYMGINLGAFFSPLVCGTLGQSASWGWHWGFGAAGVGMLAGLAVYHFGKGLLPSDSLTKSNISISTGVKFKMISGIFGGFLLTMVAFFSLLVIPGWAKLTFAIAVIVGVTYMLKQLNKDERARCWALIILCLGTIAFWIIFEQQGNTLQLWADEKTNWSLFGLFPIPSSWYQSFNPGFIFMFAPLLNMWWDRGIKAGKRPSSSVRKMGIGCILCGVAFLTMMLAAHVVGDGVEKGSLLWLAMTTWIFTMGELYLSPIGLSLVTKVAPARMVSMMMGVWFLSSFFGNYLSGYLGAFYTIWSKDVFFLVLTVLGITVGLLFFLADKKLSKVMGNV